MKIFILNFIDYSNQSVTKLDRFHTTAATITHSSFFSTAQDNLLENLTRAQSFPAGV